MHRFLPPPAVVALIAALMWGSAALLPAGQFQFAGQARLALGLALAAAGLMAVAALTFMHARTTINPLRPEKASHLITSGIYRYSRNPIYLADLLLLCALVLWLGKLWNLAYLPVFVAWIQHFQILPEERALRRLFGASYRDYCARVRRWL
ncbi:MAG: isoprenylcysteine carboxylmethyltransferase family protein [Burkholderiales bacterium]|nr:isoprenylcysteine carboxylmethyltransferase family protein [Burkholderiales bacterium]